MRGFTTPGSTICQVFSKCEINDKCGEAWGNIRQGLVKDVSFLERVTFLIQRQLDTQKNAIMQLLTSRLTVWKNIGCHWDTLETNNKMLRSTLRQGMLGIDETKILA